MDLVAVVTTIQQPTPSVVALAAALAPYRAPLVVIGDAKGPNEFRLEGAELLTIDHQQHLPYHLARLAPTGHYSRKNLGYLVAMARGARCIYETDDDNAPLATWTPRQRTVDRARLVQSDRWANVYQFFSAELVWPRGLPLDRIRADGARIVGTAEDVDAPIQQALANGSPDVDAIWRLVLDRDVTFAPGNSVALSIGTWCPFNSQATWWWPEAYSLLYLPSHCSFRMTDIWRSFVAQRCLWALDRVLVFHAAEVIQIRNQHRLVCDFEDEVPGYLRNDSIAEALSALHLRPGREHLGANQRACYQELVRLGVVGEDELALLDAWLGDIAAITQAQGKVAA